jgi:hypothetical protein
VEATRGGRRLHKDGSFLCLSLRLYTPCPLANKIHLWTRVDPSTPSHKWVKLGPSLFGLHPYHKVGLKPQSQNLQPKLKHSQAILNQLKTDENLHCSTFTISAIFIIIIKKFQMSKTLQVALPKVSKNLILKFRNLWPCVHLSMSTYKNVFTQILKKLWLKGQSEEVKNK